MSRAGDPSEISGSTDYDADWCYRDSYAYRVDGLGPSTTFSAVGWIVPGNDALDSQGNEGQNGHDGVTVPFGTYSRD